MSRIDRPAVIDRAAGIVRSYDTSVTLRQLFYRLVSAQLIPNTEAAYKRLSALTAQGRREGWFPALIDRGRRIHRQPHWDGPGEGMRALIGQYRRDRTEGQDVSTYLGVEKAGMVVQLESWFGPYGLPIVALGGYSSQTYVDDIISDVAGEGRDAILLYAGDFDPFGEDIDRDFIAGASCFRRVVRVALTADQVREYELPVNPGKVTDSRAPAFVRRRGVLMQVELDALPPETLRDLYTAALDPYWDTSAYEAVLEQEDIDRQVLITAREEMQS